MAYLIGERSRIYLFVTSEDNSSAMRASEHSVEVGEDITDHVRPEAEEISISGEIVGRKYKATISKLKAMEKAGELCRYMGQTKLRNCLIQSFQPGFSADIKGGCTFTMTLKKVRIAQPSYVVPTNAVPVEEKALVDAGMQSAEVASSDNNSHTVKAGDSVWALVNGPYKSCGKSCEEIMAMNPDAFSKPGDFTTLKVGARLKMG